MKWEPYSLKFLEDLLYDLPEDLFHLLRRPIQNMILELRYFMMFIRGSAYWEESEYDQRLRFVVNTMLPELRQTTQEFMADCRHVKSRDQMMNWEEISRDLVSKIQMFRPLVKEISILILRGRFKCKACSHEPLLFYEYGREMDAFIDLNLQNLKALLDSDMNLIAPVKKQIAFILEELENFGKFHDPIDHLLHRDKILGKIMSTSIMRVKKLCELMSTTRTWINHISSLACLYWIDGRDESLVSTMATMLSNLMQKMIPYSTGVVASQFRRAMIPQILARYFDFILDNLVIPVKDGIEILREGLIFLLSFVVDTPEDDSGGRELILTQIYAIINELPSLMGSIRFGQVKEGTSETKFSNFLNKIDEVKAEVREVYFKTQHSSHFNSPRTNAVGFLDSLLGILKTVMEEKVTFIPSIKHQVKIVHQELVFLRPFLETKIVFQSEQGEFEDLWARSVDVLYYAAYVINMCLPKSFSIWYGFEGLPNVVQDIKILRTEIMKIEEHQLCKNKIVSGERESSIFLPTQGTTSTIMEGGLVGFEEDARSIINCLKRGQKDLTLISISGMAGQGKTTLAKKIHNDPSVQCYFNKIVWTYVSNEFIKREFLVKIVCDVTNTDYESILKLKPTDYELSERLWKSLRGQRYLIVMDDIWEASAWEQVQASFPNDKIGSRILFTSRNHDLASQVTPKAIPHCLRLFSDEESWELMKQKVFLCDNCPPEFLEIGKQIATYCKGLPLAVSLTAALLMRTEQKPDLWNQLAENLRSHIADEGCRKVVELSYKYLPDHLKACFLYFGAFPRGENVSAKTLKLLWIAEGFIKDNDKQSPEDLADEYLSNLVSHSLVVVIERSSMGRIKKCNLHDLLYDLCLENIMEDDFLHRTDDDTIINLWNSSPQKYNHFRLCISGSYHHLLKQRSMVTMKELPASHVHSFLWFRVGDYTYCPGTHHINSVFESFKFVTVLDMDGVPLQCKFPEVLISNIYLRYLVLRGPCIDAIPPSIAELQNLETIIVKTWNTEIALPVSMWKMKSLRHVEIYRARLHLEDFEEINFFAAYNIQTFGRLLLEDDTKAEQLLRKLPSLRRLYCYFEDQEYQPVLFSMFGFLEKLEFLRINGDIGESFRYKNLPVFDFPTNLKKLTLGGLRLPWSEMIDIGKQLTNLEVLKLHDHASSGSSWELEDGGFPRLRYLRLCRLDLEQIDLSGCDSPFPCLEELLVEDCKSFKELPFSFGEICTLKTITLIQPSLEAKNSVEQFSEYLQEIGNDVLQVVMVEQFMELLQAIGKGFQVIKEEVVG